MAKLIQSLSIPADEIPAHVVVDECVPIVVNSVERVPCIDRHSGRQIRMFQSDAGVDHRNDDLLRAREDVHRG